MSVINTIKESIKETIEEVKEELKNQMTDENGESKVNPLYVVGGAAAVAGVTYLGVRHFKKGKEAAAANPEPAQTNEPALTEVPDTWLVNMIRKNLGKVGLDVCVKKEENQTEDSTPEETPEEDNK